MSVTFEIPRESAGQVVGHRAGSAGLPCRPDPTADVDRTSATSDIELQLVGGVHGPRLLNVIIVEG